MAASGEEEAGTLDRTGHDRGQIHRLLAEKKLAMGAAASIQQVIDDPRHVLSLAFHDAPCLPSGRLVGTTLMHRLQGVEDRGKRIAQLVCQGRYEFVAGRTVVL